MVGALIEWSGAEVVGWVASALVVASLTMTSVVRLRAISFVGSVAFIVYGLLIGSPPIIIANTAIACINVWFLRSELGGHRDLGASLIRPDTPFLVDFLEFHLADIRKFQPDFEMPDADAFTMVLMRDGLPAGALIGRRDGDELDITLDYVLPAFRDSRLGAWLYGPGMRVFRAEGLTRLTSSAGNDVHQAYLERMGFRSDGDRYALDLAVRETGRS